MYITKIQLSISTQDAKDIDKVIKENIDQGYSLTHQDRTICSSEEFYYFKADLVFEKPDILKDIYNGYS